MPTNLTGNSVNSTFDQLLHISDGPTVAEKTVYSGTGVPTALKLGTESASVDNVRIDGSTISTIAPDSDLVLAPNGSGTVQITGSVSFPPPAVAGSPLIRGDNVSLPNGVDLNTVVDTGFYRLNASVVNGPAGAPIDYGQLIVSKGADTITQIVASFSTGEMWTRSGYPPEVGGPGSWSAWLKAASPVATQAEMEAGTETAIRNMSPQLVAQAIAALGSSGLIRFSVITTTTSAWAPDPNTKKLVVACFGGGGGGGAYNINSGGGGKAGCGPVMGITTTVSGTYNAIIGAGGSGGFSAGNGSTGGTTSFSGTGVSVSALGGKGGIGNAGYHPMGDSGVGQGGNSSQSAPANSAAGGGGAAAIGSGGAGGSGIIYVWEFA